MRKARPGSASPRSIAAPRGTSSRSAKRRGRTSCRRNSDLVTADRVKAAHAAGVEVCRGPSTRPTIGRSSRRWMWTESSPTIRPPSSYGSTPTQRAATAVQGAQRNSPPHPSTPVCGAANPGCSRLSGGFFAVRGTPPNCASTSATLPWTLTTFMSEETHRRRRLGTRLRACSRPPRST